ncbi:16S rRNA (uracil(1498)-N(3))-methyltransferase [Rugosimonospora africana]|uniref:Ribosomal RNA small subunit methyltransferase E n=1 Tax=Rugosimonospora africana TaxID=556532 RepID=A0A8J3R0K4_9ACTN|nr:16S rRNA (uracil(1498)-N(3))-methyltransferase [Rugosimonospora africana]GIH19996.1 ribosomal RNA small subunit methyltransferase E [Rugosimonospora africana]
MSLSLFLAETLPPDGEFTLDGPEGHHAADVARLRVGEALLLGDGQGATAHAVVRAVRRGALDLSIMERWYAAPPDPRLVVAQGIAKGERGELAVQAMTEVGVDEIVPWPAARSVAVWRDEKPLSRWRATVREAAKQARRPWIPEVSAALPTARLAQRATLVLDSAATVPLSAVDLPGHGDIVLVVGPEGGIAPEELDAFTAAGAVPVRLGDSILRTSTAGVAALAVLSARLGRW